MPESVSLCIPLHRSAAFLPELFARLRALNPVPSEILFLDDASEDDSAALVRRFIEAAALASEVRLLVNTANAGIAGAYNRMAREATGDWVHILDADDYPEEADFYARVKTALQPRYDIVVTALTSNARLLNRGSSALSRIVPREPPLWWPLLGSFATRSGVLYRRASLVAEAFPDPAYPGSDIVQLLRMRQGRGCAFLKSAHVYYRVHTSATSSGRRDYAQYRVALGGFGIGTRWAHRLDLALRVAGQRVAR